MFTMRSSAVAVCAAMMLGACSGAVVGANPERDADTDALLADVGAGRIDTVVAKMSKDNSPEQVRAQLPMLKTMVPEGAVPAGVTVGWRAFTGTGGSTYESSRTYDYPDRVLSVATTFRKEGEAWKVQAFNINVQVKPGTTPTAPKGDEAAEDSQPVQVITRSN
jgi:hypothetical protein